MTQGTLVISEVRVGPGVKRKKLKGKVQDNTFEMMEIDSLSLFFFYIYLLISLCLVLVAALRIFSCRIQDVVPLPGIQLRPSVLGAWES